MSVGRESAGPGRGRQDAPLGVPVTTTYITGTWVAISAGTAALARGRAAKVPTRQRRTQVLVVVAYLATACLAGAVAHATAPGVATAVPLGLMALVTLGCPGGRARAEET